MSGVNILSLSPDKKTIIVSTAIKEDGDHNDQQISIVFPRIL